MSWWFWSLLLARPNRPRSLRTNRAEEAPAEEPAQEAEEEKAPDYFQKFEDAVFQKAEEAEDAIPEAEDGDDAPMFRF